MIPTEDFSDVTLANEDTDDHDDCHHHGDQDVHDDHNDTAGRHKMLKTWCCTESWLADFTDVTLASEDTCVTDFKVW